MEIEPFLESEEVSSQIEELECLVDELIKSPPDEEVVKKRMEKLGFPYTEDPISRMNMVLKALHFEGKSQEASN